MPPPETLTNAGDREDGDAPEDDSPPPWWERAAVAAAGSLGTTWRWLQGGEDGWGARWAQWKRDWRMWSAGPKANWARRWARWKAWLGARVPAWSTWTLVAVAWALVTWAVMDAVPGRWESVTWKASAGLFAAGLVGVKMWAKLLGYGVYLLRELEDDGDRRRRRR